MGKKVVETAVKIYKPEILACPICNSALKYKYTISNKVVQFTSGKIFRIKNLGYGCLNCNDSNIYFSQTANKLCFKGYTYSAKAVCLIAYYKSKHLGREGICDILASKGIEISDRNIDILYSKFKETYTHDYDAVIKEAYKNMLDKYNEIRISIDLITIEDTYYVILYDFFTSHKLAIWTFNEMSFEALNDTLSKYINEELKITIITSIRNNKDNKFIPILKKLSPKSKFIAFTKF